MEVSYELSEFEDVYAEVIGVDINEESSMQYAEIKLKVIGEYRSENDDKVLKNGDEVTLVINERDTEKLIIPEKGDIIQISCGMDDGNFVFAESIEKTSLPFSLQRYHNPALFWLSIIGSVMIVTVLLIVLIRLLRNKKRPLSADFKQ